MTFIIKHRWPWYVWAAGAVVLLAVISAASLFTARSGISGQKTVSQLAMRSSGISATGLAAPSMMAEDYAVSNDGGSYTKSSDEMAIGRPVPAPSAGATAAEVDQKIIKTASLDLQVTDVPEAARNAVTLATERGGFVQESSVSENGAGRKFGSVTVRVPSEKFDSLLVALRGLALVVRNESVAGQDVTEQYTDLAARLKNAKAQEATYLAVLAQAKSVEDILKVQNYLGNIRETIERYEGQLKYLENRTSLSTVSVSFSEEPAVPVPGKEFRPATAVQEAWRTLVALAQALLIFLIWFAIIGGAFLLPLVLIIWLIVWLVRRKFRKEVK
jgi:hypothetical protein